MEIQEIHSHVIIAAIGICEKKKNSDTMIAEMIQEEKKPTEHNLQTIAILQSRAKRLDEAMETLKELLL